MKKSRVMGLFLAWIMVCSMVGCGGSTAKNDAPANSGSGAEEKSYTIRIVNACGPGSPYDYGTSKFKEMIEEKTGGRVTVTVYNGDMSTDEIECAEMVQNNNVEIAWISSGALGGFVPNLAVLELPFLFKDDNHITAALEGELGKTLLEQVDGIEGITGLAFHQDGWRNILTNNVPIQTVEDMKGVRMRSMQNEVCIAMYEALGATPVALASGEQFTGIQSGVVDGTDNSAIFAVSDGYISVVNCICDIHHFYAGGIVLASTAWFESLSEADRAMIYECAEAAGREQRAWFLDTDESLISEYEEKGYTVTRPTDIDAWKAATEPVYEKMYAAHPEWKDLVQLAKDAGQ